MTRAADAATLSVGDRVIQCETWRYYRPVCTVRAIQRRRFRAEITRPDNTRSWVPIRTLLVVEDS